MLQVSNLEYSIGKEAMKGYSRLAIHTILLTVKIWPVIIASNLPIVDLLSFFR